MDGVEIKIVLSEKPSNGLTHKHVVVFPDGGEYTVNRGTQNSLANFKDDETLIKWAKERRGK